MRPDGQICMINIVIMSTEIHTGCLGSPALFAAADRQAMTASAADDN